jgi:maltooligosyltrehalose trehalohydrolase
MNTEEMRAALPKPGLVQTFEACKLSDEERHDDTPLRRLHRDLLRLRRDDIVLRDVGTPRVAVESSAPSAAVVLVRYITDAHHRLLVVNCADDYISHMNDPLLAPLPDRAWVQLWSSEASRYGGSGALSVLDSEPWIIPAGSALLLASHEL